MSKLWLFWCMYCCLIPWLFLLSSSLPLLACLLFQYSLTLVICNVLNHVIFFYWKFIRIWCSNRTVIYLVKTSFSCIVLNALRMPQNLSESANSLSEVRGKGNRWETDKWQVQKLGCYNTYISICTISSYSHLVLFSSKWILRKNKWGKLILNFKEPAPFTRWKTGRSHDWKWQEITNPNHC